jgi:signal peptidase I
MCPCSVFVAKRGLPVITKQTPQSRSRTDRRVDSGGGSQTAAPESLKDTAESIVVAFILAFVFRAFVIEAFVIPTGSMAATLYGKHGTLVCEDCGWENAYGLTDPSLRAARFGPDSAVRCQNCNHMNSGLPFHDGSPRRGHRSGAKANAESGDRILVFKWPLDFGLDVLGPERWDVTVFKNPANGGENFIKRLVGLPGEVLEIIDGDVYTVPTSELSDKTFDELDELRVIKSRRVHSNRSLRGDERRLREGPSTDALGELADKLRIPRRSANAAKSLWIDVYNHDYPPRVLDRNQPFWKPVATLGTTNWKTEDRRLVFDGASGGRATAVFSGKPIVDHNAYNLDERPRTLNPVSDQRLQFVVVPTGGDGFIEVVLSKRADRFVAKFSADGKVSLLKRGSDSSGSNVLAEALINPWTSDEPFEVVFQNVDYRVSIEVNGREIAATTHEQYAPDIRALRVESRPPPARSPQITAQDIGVELRHVALYRDEYYTAPTFQGSAIAAWADKGWGTRRNPILLVNEEYFMLGDNSTASKDSRLWDRIGDHLIDRGESYQLGTVPKDQLVGRAFFVYWPSGLRPPWLPVLSNFGIVPNVGRMRWIR